MGSFLRTGDINRRHENVHNLMAQDIRSYEVYVWVDDRRAITGWIKVNKLNGRCHLNFSSSGLHLYHEIGEVTWMGINSMDQAVRGISQAKVANIVAQFVMRAEATARGGYA